MGPGLRRELRLFGCGAMRFGEVPVAEAEGAILAHSLKLGTTALKKARRAVARRCRVDRRRRARRMSSRPARSRRSARGRGRRPGRRGGSPGRTSRRRPPLPAAPICSPRRAASWCSIATGSTGSTSSTRRSRSAPCRPSRVVEPRQMVATVKIIPFAAPEAAVERCVEAAAAGGPLLRVAAFVPRAVGAGPDPAARAQGKHPRQDPAA